MAPILPSLYTKLKVKTDEARSRIRAATGDELMVYLQARRRARRKNIDFLITRGDFDLLVTRAGGRCEETGKQFEQRTNSTGRYRDHWMSIDRVEPKGPYSFENCRLVTAAVNFAKGDQSVENFHIQKLMYVAALGGTIDDEFLLSREGSDPDRWKF